MNEENITNIVTYLQQNPTQTTETLVQNLIDAGYTTTDIRIGLARLGLSPIALPSTAPVMSTPQASLLSPSRVVLAIAGSIIILIGVFYIGNTNIAKIVEKVPLLGKKPQLYRPDATNKNNPKPENIKPTSKEKESPLPTFLKSYNNGTFKITEQVYFNGITDEKFDFTYYTENGFVDRIDHPVGLSTIMRTNAYYVLRHSTKMYFKVESTDLQYGPRSETLQKLLIFNKILIDSPEYVWEKKDELQWKLNTGKTSNYYLIEFNNQGLPIHIKEYSLHDKLEKDLAYTYEAITINDELLIVPTDYTEVSEKEIAPENP